MLCCVLAVHPLAIVVSMCDQLLGHVPVTSVSEKLTDRLQRTLDDDEDEETAPELSRIHISDTTRPRLAAGVRS